MLFSSVLKLKLIWSYSRLIASRYKISHVIEKELNRILDFYN